MRYKVEYTDSVLKYLKKLDKQIARMLVGYIRKNLDGCSNPRAYGKALKGKLDSQRRYRFGDYRILAIISDETITILVMKIGQRHDVYKD